MAVAPPAKVALLYSSASDIWTLGDNLAYGFDRMHTWLALTHAQVPVDVVAARQVERGMLKDYTVCYLSGPNLTRAAATNLREWVAGGGTLWLSADAASRDEYNRPLDTLDDLLPAVRDASQARPTSGPGRYLRYVASLGTFAWQGGTGSVLSVRQTLAPREGAAVLATFGDGSPAIVRGSAGKGRIYCVGMLPALDYIRKALDARFALEELARTNAAALPPEAAVMLERSYNPWEYPAATRDLITTPVREAGVVCPVRCSVPLVDAVYMPHEKGILVPLANYVNTPLTNVTLNVEVAGEVERVESARRGGLRGRDRRRDRLSARLGQGTAHRDHVRRDVRHLHTADGQTRMQQQPCPDHLHRFFHLGKRPIRLLDNLRILLLLKLLEMLRDDRAFQLVVLAHRLKLEQQTLLHGPRRDTRWIERLNQPQRPFPHRAVHLLPDLVIQVRERRPEVPIRLQMVDDHLAAAVRQIVRLDQIPLRGQVIVQRHLAGRCIAQSLKLGVLVVKVRPPRAVIRILRRVELRIHALEPLEIIAVRVVVLNDQLALRLRHRRFRLRSRRLGLAVIARLAKLQHRVLLHLLIDPLLQRRQRKLQNLHRLDHPRSQLQLLFEPQLL